METHQNASNEDKINTEQEFADYATHESNEFDTFDENIHSPAPRFVDLEEWKRMKVNEKMLHNILSIVDFDSTKKTSIDNPYLDSSANELEELDAKAIVLREAIQRVLERVMSADEEDISNSEQTINDEDDFVVNSMERLDLVDFQELENKILFSRMEPSIEDTIQNISIDSTSSPASRRRYNSSSPSALHMNNKNEPRKPATLVKVIPTPGSDTLKTLQYSDGSHYVGGTNQQNQRHGLGVMIYNQNFDESSTNHEIYLHKYEGEWQLDSKNGRGVDFYEDGSTYAGIWLNNHRIGEGTFHLQVDSQNDRYMKNSTTTTTIEIHDYESENDKTSLGEILVAKNCELERVSSRQKRKIVNNNNNNRDPFDIMEDSNNNNSSNNSDKNQHENVDLLKARLREMQERLLSAEQKIQEQTLQIIDLEEKYLDQTASDKEAWQKKLLEVNEHWLNRLEKLEEKYTSFSNQAKQDQESKAQLQKQLNNTKLLLENEQKENAEIARSYSQILIEHEVLHDKHKALEKAHAEVSGVYGGKVKAVETELMLVRDEMAKIVKETNGFVQNTTKKFEAEMTKMQLKLDRAHGHKLEDLSLKEVEEMIDIHQHTVSALFARRTELWNQQIKNAELKMKCKVCQTRQINALLLPCNHLVVCDQCERSLPNKQCPSCKKKVQKALPVSFGKQSK